MLLHKNYCLHYKEPVCLKQRCHSTWLPPPTHLEPASILLYEIIVHSTDHPLVIIQDFSLNIERGAKGVTFVTTMFYSRQRRLHHDTVQRLTGCMLISQPVFSPGSLILSKPKRASISSVNWLRSRRLRAEDPSSLIQTQNRSCILS